MSLPNKTKSFLSKVIQNAYNTVVTSNDISGVEVAIVVQGGKHGDPPREVNNVTVTSNKISDVNTGISIEYEVNNITIERNKILNVNIGAQFIKEELTSDLDLNSVLENNTFPEGFKVVENMIVLD